MKIRKIFAGMSAAAIMASMMTVVPASAANPKSTVEGVVYDEANGIWQYYITDLKDKDDKSSRYVTDDSYFESAKDLAKINGVKITFTVDDETEKLLEGRIAGTEETWVGGGFGVNSNSTGWKQFGEWGPVLDDTKEGFVVFVDEEADNTWSISYKQDDPIFTKKEEYGQVWMQSWGAGNFTVTDIEFTEVEVEPIASAYIAFGANAWVTKPTEVAGTIDANAVKGEGWDETEVPLDVFKNALAEGKTFDDVESITFDTSKNEEGARKFTVGYNKAGGGWAQADAAETAQTITPDFGEGYFLKIANNTTKDMKVDFSINYKVENPDDPHDGKWIPETYDENGKKTGEGWNTYYYDSESKSDVEQDTVPVYLDEEFVLDAKISSEIDHMWFIAPTVVFDKAFEEDEDLEAKYDITVALEIDGEKIEVNADAKNKDGEISHIWAEATGANTAANTARLYGGYNEWNSWQEQSVDEAKFEGAEEIKYIITISEKEEEEPEEPTPTKEEPKKEDPKEDPKEETPKNTTENPKTAATALGLGAIALAGAALVVSKKKD